MKKHIRYSIGLVALVSMVSMMACARFSTNQVEKRYDNGQLTGIIQTRAGTMTFFDSKSLLANFKAFQSEKTQSAVVGSLTQEAAGTNAVAMLQALSALVGALPK